MLLLGLAVRATMPLEPSATWTKRGAESVVFMTGYAKWCRAWLQRLCYSFGSPNYITVSSTCHSAEVIIDPRRTPTAVQCADLYIRPRVGTDAYLANTVYIWNPLRFWR